ncbi:MAG: hypothetical protein GY820_28725 [Gammaproteobacteria bacterium]|nr:hypothetical protein [Gammaproteobacteria bacterium]
MEGDGGFTDYEYDSLCFFLTHKKLLNDGNKELGKYELGTMRRRAKEFSLAQDGVTLLYRQDRREIKPKLKGRLKLRKS